MDPKPSYQVPLETATIEQLRWHASHAMGIEVSATMNKHTLKTKIIQAGWAHDYITYAPDKPDAAFSVPKATHETSHAVDGVPPEPWVVVTIPVSERPGGKDAVPLIVNGVAVWVKRGVPSKIKYRYFLQLQGAVETSYHQELDMRGRPGPMIPSEMPLYPHTVNHMPPEEQIEAWVAWDAEQSNVASLAKLEERRKNPQPVVFMAG